LGCWAIGGPFLLDGKPDGWGAVDDAESIRAIQRAIDLGVTFFDTADVYGTGHSERLLGQAIKGRRDKVIIATKFGFTYDETRREITGTNTSPEYIRWACAASLRRLGTDTIDLYQIHVSLPAEQAEDVLDTLDQLHQEGLIRAFGWSTHDPNSARLVANHASGAAIQHDLNVFGTAPEMLAVCTQHNLASINNSPLASGLLSGKYQANSVLPADDFRAAGHKWAIYFENGRPKPEFLDKLNAVREILTSQGRSLVQGALAWIWAKSDKTIPIPGFKTVAQAEENCAALQFGPLTPAEMLEIDKLLGRGGSQP
jgi:aryl-alcohol dehydrogenase-like predicted oxidoreductase